MCKEKCNSLNFDFKKLIDYHRGIGNHTTFQDSSYEENEHFHLHCQFNKKFYDLIEALIGETFIVYLHTTNVKVKGDKTYKLGQEKVDEDYMQSQDNQIYIQACRHGTRIVDNQGPSQNANSQEIKFAFIQEQLTIMAQECQWFKHKNCKHSCSKYRHKLCKLISLRNRAIPTTYH